MATAAAGTYPSERGRALLGQHLGVPDPVLGVVEDALVLGVATAAAGAPDAGDGEGDAPDPTSERPSALSAAVRGLLAAAVGTAAMTSVQVAYLSATGGEPSSAPPVFGCNRA